MDEDEYMVMGIYKAGEDRENPTLRENQQTRRFVLHVVARSFDAAREKAALAIAQIGDDISVNRIELA